jgi:hypothetical protein
MKLLKGNSFSQSGYEFDASEEYTASKEVRIEAYKLLIAMSSYVPVDFPLQMLVADVTDMNDPDFNLVN